MTIEVKWWLAVPLWLWAISLVVGGVATWVHLVHLIWSVDWLERSV
jgi:hypothetical protein